MERLGISISWSNIRITQNFGSDGINNVALIITQKLCGKAMPSDMNVVHRGYQMVIGTRGDIDIDFADVARYEEYEDTNGTHIFIVEKGVHTSEYSKGVYVDKEYVSIESDVEIPKPILDKMDTIKKMRFIGPITWFLANLLNN